MKKLYRAIRKGGKFVLGREKIREWLLKQKEYAVHRETRSKFKRKRVVAPFVDYQWDVDTANITFYKKDNDGTTENHNRSRDGASDTAYVCLGEETNTHTK